jgi:hypothetical protein
MKTITSIIIMLLIGCLSRSSELKKTESADCVIKLILQSVIKPSMVLALPMPGVASLLAKTGLLKNANKLPTGFSAPKLMKTEIPKESDCPSGGFTLLPELPNKAIHRVLQIRGAGARVFFRLMVNGIGQNMKDSAGF